MKLNELKIKNAQPKEKPYKLSDFGGLSLLIHPNGSKYWRWKYRWLGAERTDSLGIYPEVSLKAARAKHTELRSLLYKGEDPRTQLKRGKFTDNDLHCHFDVVADEWYQKKISAKSKTHQERTKRLIEKDLSPYLKGRAVRDIGSLDLLRVLNRIEARGAVDTAYRAKGVAGQIFRYAVATGRAERDITPDLKDALTPKSKTHFAAITSPSEAGRLLSAIYQFRGTSTVSAALKLSPLVFARPGEIRHMEWSEVDWDRCRWEIPKNKIKSREKLEHNHVVPLCKQAIDILRDQYLLTGRGKYVFPSIRGSSRPMSENTIRAAIQTLGFPKEEMTAHGFRAMARTLLAEELEFRVDIIEHQLGHVVRDANGYAYNRTTFIEQRIDMMQKWADYLDELRGVVEHGFSIDK